MSNSGNSWKDLIDTDHDREEEKERLCWVWVRRIEDHNWHANRTTVAAVGRFLLEQAEIAGEDALQDFYETADQWDDEYRQYLFHQAWEAEPWSE